MKALATLIRLHKQRLDEKRTRLVELETKRDAMRARAADLAAALESEARFVGVSHEANRAFPPYAKRVGGERRVLAEGISALDAEITELGEAIYAEYQEIKTYEVTRDRREQRERATEARRDQAGLDEVGLTVHRRK